MLYYQRIKNPEIKIIPALYNIREMNEPNFEPYLTIKAPDGNITITPENYKTYMYKFHDLLANTINEILNPAMPFFQTLNIKKCSFCPYSGICNK